MSTIIVDCPRCGARNSTMVCHASQWVSASYNWKNYAEVFAVSRGCHKSSILVLSQENNLEDIAKIFRTPNGLSKNGLSLNDVAVFVRVITNLDRQINDPPEHLPKAIEAVMLEANKCLSAQCWNAAGAMYRLALDLATKGVVPDGETAPASKIVRNLGLRLPWLFENGFLPSDLKELAQCLQQDGNDGAHDGTLEKADVEDLHDFSFELLRRLFTEPERVKIAHARREARRDKEKL